MKDAIIIIGRFQPFHLGHQHIIEAVSKENPNAQPIIALIENEGNPNDIKRPFPSSLIKSFIDRVFYDIIVLEVKSANILEIADEIEKYNYQVAGIYTGSDRTTSYENMLHCYRDDYITIKNDAFVRTFPRNTSESKLIASISATKIRTALKENDFKSYKMMMPKPLATNEVFNLLRMYMLKGV